MHPSSISIFSLYNKNNNKKSSRINNIGSRIFKILLNSKAVGHIFCNFEHPKPSMGSCEVPHKIRTRSVQPFWRLLDTNISTYTLSIYILEIQALRTLLSRLLGRFAPIFMLNCEHVLFVYILKQRWKNFADLKKIADFQTFKTQIFKISIIHKPSLGSLDVPQKIWARSGQPFWRLLDTNRQTPKQTPKPNLCIDLL